MAHIFPNLEPIWHNSHLGVAATWKATLQQNGTVAAREIQRLNEEAVAHNKVLANLRMAQETTEAQVPLRFIQAKCCSLCSIPCTPGDNMGSRIQLSLVVTYAGPESRIQMSSQAQAQAEEFWRTNAGQRAKESQLEAKEAQLASEVVRLKAETAARWTAEMQASLSCMRLTPP